MKTATIHRFGNLAVITLNSVIIYLQAEDAKVIAKAIAACADDIQRVRYEASTLIPVQLALQGDL